MTLSLLLSAGSIDPDLASSFGYTIEAVRGQIFDLRRLPDLAEGRLEELIDALEAQGMDVEEVLPKVFLQVDGMMCQNNCGTTVRNALKGVANVAHVEVSFPLSRAVVSGHAVDPTALVSIVDMVGFDCFVKEEGWPGVKQEGDNTSLVLLPPTIPQKLASNKSTPKKSTQKKFTPKKKPQFEAISKPEASSSSDSSGISDLESSDEDSEEDLLLSSGPKDEIAAKCVLKISGMSCTACVASIENKLPGLDGVEGVQVALISGKGTVSYDPNVISSEQILDKMASLG